MKFELNQRQMKRLREWIGTLEGYDEACEEDCCCSSPLSYTFRPSGIGDDVKVVYGNNEATLDLSIDDDGNWVTP